MAVELASPRAFTVHFKDLIRWDIKTARAVRFYGEHPSLRPLSEFAEEATEIVRPREKGEHEWPVYGVNNETGVFLSHLQRGKAFNAPYKQIRKDWFFHNPTRANVGSLGRVPDVPEDAITSPEYQVWRIRRGITPDFMELLLRLPFFQKQVEFHRVGAVKERLFVQNLLEIRIPTLPGAQQAAIVARWRKVQEAAARSRDTVAAFEVGIPLEIYKALGTPVPAPDSPLPKLLVVGWKELERWSFNYIARARNGLLGFTKSRYPIQSLDQHLIGTMNGYCIKPVQTHTPHKMLKLSALTPAGLDVRESKFVKVSDGIAQRFHIRKADLLICRSNSYEYVAKTAVVDRDQPNILFPDIIIRARIGDGLLVEYAREVIDCPLGRAYFQVNSRRAVGGMWKIGAEDIRNFPIPIPPMEVQRKIVDMVNEKRTWIAAERKAVEERKAQAIREVEEMILGVRSVG
jgi:type I restriction enzyme, S subunit